MCVLAGLGIPSLIPAITPPDRKVIFHAEHGITGFGGYPLKGKEDSSIINDLGETVTITPQGTGISMSTSMGIIRGGLVHIAFIGALQVSAQGDFANWSIPGKAMNVGLEISL
jgi:3-oxoacid CoA-transferase B subunit